MLLLFTPLWQRSSRSRESIKWLHRFVEDLARLAIFVARRDPELRFREPSHDSTLRIEDENHPMVFVLLDFDSETVGFKARVGLECLEGIVKFLGGEMAFLFLFFALLLAVGIALCTALRANATLDPLFRINRQNRSCVNAFYVHPLGYRDFV